MPLNVFSKLYVSNWVGVNAQKERRIDNLSHNFVDMPQSICNEVK